MPMIKGHNFPGGKSVMPKTVKGEDGLPQVAKAPPKKNMVESVTVRPIDNGYLIEKSSHTEGPGPYRHKSKTVYSPTKPKLGV